MDQRAHYLVQVLEKIGAPLMSAVTQVAARGPDDGQDAQKIAALLAKTVQASIEIGNATEVARATVSDDSLRVALAGLAGPLIAEQFRGAGKIPGDADIKRMVTALQAVMTFSENFAPGPENARRLEQIAASGQPVDPHQADVQYIHAFVPVVNAVSAFSFGQSEQKLILEIGGRLVARAAELREALAPGLSEDDQKITELAILRALAPVYAACHTAETERLARQGADAAGVTMGPLWTAFDLRTSMLEALIKNILPGRAARSSGSAGPGPQHGATAPQQNPAPPVPPAAPPVQASQQEQAPDSGNPMSVFAKPRSDAQPAPPTAPPAQQSPPPPQQAQQPGAAQASPMSFFKAPPKGDDE